MSEEVQLPISALQERYSISRSQVYARLEALKDRDKTLVLQKQNRKAYADKRLVDAMDSLHALLDKGASLASAADKVLAIQSEVSDLSTAQPNKTVHTISDRPSDLASSTGELADKQPAPNLLNRYRALDEIAEKGWYLPTSEIAALLGIEISSDSVFECYGFRFTQSGQAGSEKTWKVEKL